jgi:two-component system chemotaxis sensor kinase CheA
VNEVSGRGIGLDVVRETAARLKGEVAVRSEAGRGTIVEISVPVSLSSLAALEVDAGGAVAAFPLESVRRVLRVSDHDIARSPSGDSIAHQGKVIPFVHLSRALGWTAVPRGKGKAWSAVLVEGSSGLAAVGVDRLRGAASVVVQPLPEMAAADAMVLGASLDSGGNPQLVLDPDGLLAAARVSRAPAAEAAARRRPPVLIVDDSLTTRMLEQSILESAGYEVDLATSAEEGLIKAHEKQYGLFLVDIEMPGMDGFDFVLRTKSDAALRDVPAILVTSRNAPEDRRRGVTVGALGYIVKGEFDQGRLLGLIGELIG